MWQTIGKNLNIFMNSYKMKKIAFSRNWGQFNRSWGIKF